jgi:hypothetical protein
MYIDNLFNLYRLMGIKIIEDDNVGRDKRKDEFITMTIVF